MSVNEMQVFCKKCLRVVATRPNTTNVFKDEPSLTLQRLYDEKKSTRKQQIPSTTNNKQTLIAEAFSNVTPYKKASRRRIQITEAITHHIAKDMVPININTVSKDGFRKMINKLDRRYKIPSRTYFSQDAIPILYNKIKREVVAQLTRGL